MQKKVLLTLLLVSLLVCVFAFGVSAAGAETNTFGEITPVEGVTAPTVIDSTSRVVIKASDGTYYTFPSYYILADNATFTWKKNEAVNEILGINVSAQELRKNIVRMEIPEGVTQMNPNTDGGACVFEDAKIMVEATIPSTMEYIGAYAFQRCYELVTINGLKEHLAKAKRIGPMILNGTQWGAGIDLVFAEGLETIPNNSFKGTKIKSVTFPSTLTRIDERAFQGCTNLTSVTIPASVVTIKNHIFADCTKLTSIDLSACKSLEEIGEFCFEKAGITSFDFTPFASSLETMGMGLFNCCGSLTTVTGFELLVNIGTVGNNMFYQCPLTEINFPPNITSIGNYAYFQHKSTQTEIRIPNGVTYIGNHALVRNSSAAGVEGVKIYLPASLETVSNDYTFEYWDFAEMYIPSSFVNVPTGFVNGTNETGTVYYYTGDLNGLTISGTNNKALLNAEWVHVDAFTGVASDKNIIVYGYNVCDAFYQGVHDVKTAMEGSTCQGECERVGCDEIGILANPEHQNAWMFTDENGNEMNVTALIVAEYKCADCKTVESREEISPLFVAVGYTFNEEEPSQISYRAFVKQEPLARYEELSGQPLKYGLVAGIAGQNPDGKPLTFNAETQQIGTVGSVVYAQATGTDYTSIEIKLTGINTSTTIYCNAFAVVNSKISYICDTTGDTASYKNIVIPVK